MTNLELNYLNLGTYEMGSLELPATEEEISTFFATLNPTDQDCELQWVETKLNNSHLDRLSLDQLQHIADMDEDEAENLLNVMDIVGNFDEAVAIFDDEEFTVYEGCWSMSDVAYEWIHNHVGSIEDAVSKDRIEYYIDAEAVKRDLEIEGYWTEREEEGEEIDDSDKENEVADMIEQGMFSGESYFDYEAFGRDMEMDGTFSYVGQGVYIQLWY